MSTFTFGDKTYPVDTEEFLSDFNDWDENFARGIAPKVAIISGLSEDHWKIINFIRDYFKRTGKCPLVYETCRMTRLPLRELQKLFQAGYLRGACKLAGVTYKEGYYAPARSRLLDQSFLEELAEAAATGDQEKKEELAERATTGDQEEKTFEVNIQGFLSNPQKWDKSYAIYKAHEMKMPKLTDKHWQVINFLRQSFEKTNVVPTIYETCEACDIDLEKLQKLFPDGYHRGAVKIAGLKTR
ncbi:MAG: TusE/DsrC/DsvC family sulfur relay protein [Desulfobaccales bacterium]